MPPSAIARQFLATNLWILIVAAFFVFFVNGIIWASIFQYYFASWNMELIGLAGASLSLIVGSVYSAFLSKVTRDYLSGPVDYSKLLTSISHAGDAIAGYYRIRDDKELREAMIDFKSILQHLAFYSYRLFAPTNIDRL